MAANNEAVLEYYKRELAYLRRMGAAFAEQYPKIAGRLELEMDQCPDPHIERLIESFAFLTARIQYNIESEFPQLSAALLGILYPQFLNPTPSVTIARFEPDLAQGGLTTGHLIPKHTPLFAGSEHGEICRFRTCYPVTLWPLEIAYAGFESTDKFDFLDNMPNIALVLRIQLETRAASLAELSGLHGIRFYLNGDRMLSNALYELLFCHVSRVALMLENNSRPLYLADNAILPVGFAPDEDVLPYPPNAHAAYRMIHEFFTFPGKFLFFDLDMKTNQGKPQVFNPENKRFDILFLLDEMPGERLVIEKNTFCLGCTPIINLFKKTTDPVRLDQKLPEYLLVPDMRREKTTEIHSILSVSASSDTRDISGRFEPFFSFNHHMECKGHKAFWHAMRRDSERKDLPGTQMYISFVDLDFKTALPDTPTVFAHALCTNRELAEEIPAGAVLQIEMAAPLSNISVLSKPTPQINPPLKGAALWRLISHLSLNYLSLSQGTESLDALKEILKLYSFSDHADVYQKISGIRAMSCRNVVRRLGDEAWRGFCRGTEVTLEFDERLYVGSGAFLLATVLNRFFPLYASINTFTQLIIKSKQREGIWKAWQPMIGEQIVF